MKKRLKKASRDLVVSKPNKTRSTLATGPSAGSLTHHIAPEEILVVVAEEGVYTFKHAHLIKVLKGPR